MLRFTEFLLEKDIEFDEKKHRWITIKDKDMQNQHIMIKKKDGTIVAGMGGKHTGDTLDDVYDGKKKPAAKKQNWFVSLEKLSKEWQDSVTPKGTDEEIYNSLSDDAKKEFTEYNNERKDYPSLQLSVRDYALMRNVLDKDKEAYDSFSDEERDEYDRLNKLSIEYGLGEKSPSAHKIQLDLAKKEKEAEESLTPEERKELDDFNTEMSFLNKKRTALEQKQLTVLKDKNKRLYNSFSDDEKIEYNSVKDMIKELRGDELSPMMFKSSQFSGAEQEKWIEDFLDNF